MARSCLTSPAPATTSQPSEYLHTNVAHVMAGLSLSSQVIASIASQLSGRQLGEELEYESDMSFDTDQ